MCGIIGIYTRRREGLEARAEAALEAIGGRGPDSRKVLYSGMGRREGCYGALGASRLAMVDVGGSHQPMETADGRYRIAYNGELWNYRDLRAEREAAGDVFSTRGDTEVVLNAVVREGPGAPIRFRGQFAYIVEDAREGVVHAGRDPHGICPFFYGKNEDGDLVIASIVPVLLENGVKGKDIRVLPQGYAFVYEMQSGHLSFHRYYDIATRLRGGGSCPDIVNLRETLVRIISEKIPLEVPYVTIVGGIDSSFVTAVCAEASKLPECMITVSTTEDPGCSDVVNAGTLAGKFRIESRVSLVDEDYVEKNLERVVAALCSANYLEVLTGILGLRAAEMAAEAGAKAIITGGGSDELFGGYDFAWKMFEPERLEENLLHVYRQSGIFECHREDAVCTSLGIEVRPAYYDTDLAELILSLPASERIEGLGTETITEKAILKRIARGLLPDGIVDARKAPFYRSTSIVGLFERVAERAMSERDAERWRAEALKKNPALARSMMMRGRGPVLVYKTFASIYPGLDDLPCPMGPPDYGAPDSYGRFYCFFGSPLLAGYRWRSACTEKW